MKNLISIIIPAHNEENYLGRTLAALKCQTHRYFETIVVCNACSDRTVEIARSQCDRVIVLPERGLSLARNLGGKKARGDLLLFLDADTLLEPEGLERITREFSPHDSVGTVKGVPDSRRLVHRLMYVMKNLLHRTGIHRGSSGLIVCWKDNFKRAGGFDEALHLRENSDLIKKLRHHGRYRYIGSTTATTSMRRYQRGGAKAMLHWVKVWFISLFWDIRNRTYEAVR